MKENKVVNKLLEWLTDEIDLLLQQTDRDGQFYMLQQEAETYEKVHDKIYSIREETEDNV